MAMFDGWHEDETFWIITCTFAVLVLVAAVFAATRHDECAERGGVWMYDIWRIPHCVQELDGAPR